jgi:NADH-quinone oxidoreductase subunit C
MTEPARPPAAPGGAPTAEAPPPPPPHPIVARLSDRFPDIPPAVAGSTGQLALTLERERMIEVMTFLRDDTALQFNQLADVTAVDYLEYNPDGGPPGQGRTPRFDVVYHLYSIPRNHRLRVKVAVSEVDEHLPSAISIWPSANWAERETFDLYGIVFDGHSTLTRILMPDDWEGHPLRKDYPLIEEEIEFSVTLEQLNEKPRKVHLMSLNGS